MSQRHEYRLPPLHSLRSSASSSSAAIKRPQEIAHFSYVAHRPLPSNAPDPSNVRHYGSTLDPPPTNTTHPEANGHIRNDYLGKEGEEADSNAHSRSRVLHHDARAIKYYYSPQIGSSLSDGFDTFQKLDDGEDEHLDGLLASISHLEMLGRGGVDAEISDGVNEHGESGTAKERQHGWKIKPDFMTWRGMMTKIMAAPYSNYDGFEMNATLFDGTIYIEESHTAKLASRAQQAAQHRPPRPGQPSQELMSYWGYKFETLCMLPDTWDNTSRKYIETRPKHVVNNYEQYISVVQTGLGDLSLVLGGEVDGVWDSLPVGHERVMQPTKQTTQTADEEVGRPATIERPNHIELKTSAEHEYILSYPSIEELHQHDLYAEAHPFIPGTHFKQMHPTPPPRPSQTPTTASLTRFNRKLLKFWIQSFLLGIPKIIVGFRTNDAEGRLLRVEELATTQIPRMVAESVTRHPASQGTTDGDRSGRGRGPKPLEPAWEKDVCINFARDFLTFVKDVIHKDSAARGGVDGGVWKIRRVDRSPVIEVFKVEESGYGDILSREFVEWRICGDALKAAREGALERLHRDVWAGDGQGRD